MRRERGITLIALIVTIIVLIILAGVSTQLLLGENGIIAKAKKGKGDYEESAVREKVELALVDYNSDKITKGEEGEIEEALNKLLDNHTFEDIEIEEKIGIIDDYEITLGKEKGEVIIDAIDKVTGSLRLRCKVSTKEYTKDSITIHVKASGNIAKLIKPDNKEVTPINGKIEIDYPVNENGTYIFKVEDTEGNLVEKQVVVDNIDTLVPQDFTITVEQVDKKIVITANAEDTIDITGKSACSGIGRYEYFIKKSTETNYPEKPYTTNQIEITEYGTYKIFVKAYDRAENSKACKEEMTIEIINPKVSKYGQKVNYSANGVNDWKIFYINEERNETFIITSGYLPSGKVPTTATGMTTSGTYGASWKTIPSYKKITQEVRNRFMMSWDKNETNKNIACISRLLDNEAWSDFVTEELKAKGSTAIGSPTLEMFMASWNELWSQDSLSCIEKNNYGMIANCSGNGLISDTYNINFRDCEGKKDKLFFPYDTIVDSAHGYFLASPSPATYGGGQYIYTVRYTADIFTGWDNWANSAIGIRPVVAISSDLLHYNTSNQSWDIIIPN